MFFFFNVIANIGMDVGLILFQDNQFLIVFSQLPLFISNFQSVDIHPLSDSVTKIVGAIPWNRL
jgi:hypothetical protein